MSPTLHTKGWYSRLVDDAQEGYFGVIAMVIVVSSITGGVALMYIFLNRAPFWEMIVAIALVLVNNNMPVAQQKLKPVITTFIITEAGNLLLLLINLIRSSFS